MKDLYDLSIKLFEELMSKNKAAMIICQSQGFNGFKRWHRRRIKKFLCLSIEFANELFDNYWKLANYSIIPSAYNVSSLQEHLAEWDKVLEFNLESFIDINKKFVVETGSPHCLITKAIACIHKDREKVHRWYSRFVASNWSAHDMHYVDDALHEHEKKREKKHDK